MQNCGRPTARKISRPVRSGESSRGRCRLGSSPRGGGDPAGRRSLTIWLDANKTVIRLFLEFNRANKPLNVRRSLTRPWTPPRRFRSASIGVHRRLGCGNDITREFDPGSESTLAARLTHASRTRKWGQLHKYSGVRVSNTWTTCRRVGNNPGKPGLIPHTSPRPPGCGGKRASGSARGPRPISLLAG